VTCTKVLIIYLSWIRLILWDNYFAKILKTSVFLHGK
jgi:hypothetical protein